MNILWDFDGTLFDTYPVYTDTLYRVLGEKFDKEGIYQNLKISQPHTNKFYGITEEQTKEYKRLKNLISPENMRPFDGVEEVLKFADKNVIMTHKSREGVLAILKYYGFESYFTDMVTIDDGFPRKPHSASYKHLHDLYNIDLAIGDREFDLLPAKELGIKTCAFQNNFEFADYQLNDYQAFFNLEFHKSKL